MNFFNPYVVFLFHSFHILLTCQHLHEANHTLKCPRALFSKLHFFTKKGILFPMEENPIIPPGVRFHPSDEELINYYLVRKLKSLPLPPNIITDIELYSYNPWDLPRKALFGEDERYFFTPRDRKYPNGGRPNRTTASGYWKATGTDKPILSSYGSRQIGVKKALVFYRGKPPTGRKMDWIMTEYRLPDNCRPLRSKGSMRLDDWVLCRIRQKGNMSKNAQDDHEDKNSCELLQYLPPKIKNLPDQDGRDMLADYLLSSEYHIIASLLIGNDPEVLITIPGAISDSGTGLPKEETGAISDSGTGLPKEENRYTNIQLPTKMETDEPNYSANAYANLDEFDLAALSEKFLNSEIQ